MAPARAFWKGYLKLSLVSCPIALYTGTSATERVSFRQINNKTGTPRTADDTAPILVPDGAGIWTFGDHLRHLAGHAGTIPLARDEAVAASSAYAVASSSRTRNRWCETVQGRKAWRGAGVIRPGSDRTNPALKMPVAEAIGPLQLVDRTVLEGMGPPTVGFNARSELPTDPTALSGASVGRTSVTTRIS